MAVKHQRRCRNGMYVGPKKGRFSAYETGQCWLLNSRGGVAMGCMLALKRAGSAFTISAHDGCKAQEAF